MTLLAQCGSRTLEQHGRLLLIVDYGTDWTHTTRFVLGVLTVICGANVILMAFMPDLRAVAIGLAPLSLVFGALFIAVGRHRAKQAEAKGDCLFTIDLDRGLLDKKGELWVPLVNLSVHRAFQLTSSSKALVLRWPGGSVEIASGNPFADDVGAMEQALKHALA